MLRRYICVVGATSWSGMGSRLCSTIPPTTSATGGGDGSGLGMGGADGDAPHPLASRKVKFVTAGSTESSPRAAASEAFDTAVAALDQKPNFCWFYVSLDNTQMSEAPEVLWNELCLLHGTSPGSKPPANVGMIGSALSKQKIDGSYVKVLLGCIPDLEVQPFTFNELPELKPEEEANRPPPFFCLANVDAKLQLQHQSLITSSLQTLHKNLGGRVPVAGTVLPPQLPPLDLQTSADVSLGEGMSYINDAMYKGSASGVLLRSRMVDASVVSSRPSIVLEGSKVISSVTTIEDGGVKRYVITEFEGGQRASDVVRGVYETHLQENKNSKVFIGVGVEKSMIPVSFTGDPEAGSLTLDSLPSHIELKNGDSVTFVCDDNELDTEAVAGSIMSFDDAFLNKEARKFSLTEKITVPREGIRQLHVASTACVHFSHPGLNHKAVPTNALLLKSAAQAPCIATRCVGQDFPVIGAFGPAQIAPMVDVVPPNGKKEDGKREDERKSVEPPVVSLRSASHVFLRGLE